MKGYDMRPTSIQVTKHSSSEASQEENQYKIGAMK